MQLTYYGHSAFLVDTGTHKLLFDPYITENPLAKDIDIEAINPDVILLSHAHNDHVGDTLDIAKRCNALVYGAYEVTGWVEKNGHKRTRPMNPGGFIEADFGKLRCTMAVHSSSFKDGSYGGNPVGFVIESNGWSFYYAGDTALTMDMQLIAKQHKLDFCFLPIGNNFTMGYEDACLAAEFVKCKKVIGMHYDTFGFIEIDHKKATQHFKRKQRELTLMEIGGTLTQKKSRVAAGKNVSRKIGR